MDGTPHDFSGKVPRGPRRTSTAAKLPVAPHRYAFRTD